MNRPLDLSDADLRGLGAGEVVVRDGIFSALQVAACAIDLDRLVTQDRLRVAGVGRKRRIDREVRSDRTLWDTDADADQLIGLRVFFDDVRLELNQAAWLGLARFDVQLAVFPGDGGGYVAHRDANPGDVSRRATAIVYLNPAWVPADGGCLRVSPPSGTRDLAPLGGRLVLFLADRLTHEVLPCFGSRRAATAWYGDR